MLRAIAFLSLLSLFFPLLALAQEGAPSRAPYIYSARFYCTTDSDQGLPGNCRDCWDTEIGLTNSGREMANVTIWSVEARPVLSDPPPTRSEPAIELELAPNDAVRLSCAAINRLLPAVEMLGRSRRAQPNGFLRVESDRRLKAVAVYVFRASVIQGEGSGTGIGIDVVEIEPDPG
jgi:hypothetical protein